MEAFTEEELTLLRAVAQAMPPEHWHITYDPLGTHIENGDGKGRVVFKVGEDRPDLGRDRRNLTEYFATFDPYTVRKLLYWFSVLSLRVSFDMGQENYTGTPASDALFRIAELEQENDLLRAGLDRLVATFKRYEQMGYSVVRFYDEDQCASTAIWAVLREGGVKDV